MKRSCYTGILGVLLVLCGSLHGCLAQLTQPGSGGPRLVDYALAANGATVTTSRSTSNRRPETVINGITSSENWIRGEGWEAKFERRYQKDGWRGLNWEIAPAENRGGAWIELRFPQPKRVNRVVVHTLNSEISPASRYGVYSGILRVWTDGRWETIARVKNGKIEYTKTSPFRSAAGGKIEFQFPIMPIGGVKFVVLRSNDRKSIEKRRSPDTEMSVARIIEIEVTGNETIDEVLEKSKLDDSEDKLNAIMH